MLVRCTIGEYVPRKCTLQDIVPRRGAEEGSMPRRSIEKISATYHSNSQRLLKRHDVSVEESEEKDEN